MSTTFAALWLLASVAGADPKPADVILHNGKVVTVDADFRIVQALAIRSDRIVVVGRDEETLKLKGPETQVIDLGGKTVIPGLADSHVHPSGASMYEFDHPVPDIETIDDLLKYIQARTKVVPEGEWIQIRQVFITRLRDQRYPTRKELDLVAPKHPVSFATGP
ncbi:MAG TPA: amidohydrolase family protein, partial [Planctomycetaceae bacterium]|nr:amidohydrolase family protein [Planctomycetaceae bacterium]